MSKYLSELIASPITLLLPLFLATPVYGQIDQVYDTEPPIFEQRELESIVIDINSDLWPRSSLLYRGSVDFESDTDIANFLSGGEVGGTFLYEGQPLLDIYRQEPELQFPTDSSE